MQDKYISLTPDFAVKQQTYIDRQNVWQQRYDEASGGSLSQSVGFISGLTAATFTYASRQNHGFTGFFPIARNNAAHYALIFGAGFLAYHLGSNLISSVTGDANQANYLARNKRAILNGQLSYDRPEK